MIGLPQDDEGRLKKLVRAEDFAQARFEVRFMDEDPEALAAEADGAARFLVEPATFERWLEVACTKVGVVVQKWWTGLAAEEAGVDVLKTHPEESPFDLFARMQASVRQQAEELVPDREVIVGEKETVVGRMGSCGERGWPVPVARGLVAATGYATGASGPGTGWGV